MASSVCTKSVSLFLFARLVGCSRWLMTLNNGESWSCCYLKRVCRRDSYEDVSHVEFVFTNEMECLEPSAFFQGSHLLLLHLHVRQQLFG